MLERSEHLGGRGLAIEGEGLKLNLGGHLLEDSGSGITRIFERPGKELPHGKVNSEMPVWDGRGWVSVRDSYAGSRSGLKKVVAALLVLLSPRWRTTSGDASRASTGPSATEPGGCDTRRGGFTRC